MDIKTINMLIKLNGGVKVPLFYPSGNKFYDSMGHIINKIKINENGNILADINNENYFCAKLEPHQILTLKKALNIDTIE